MFGIGRMAKPQDQRYSLSISKYGFDQSTNMVYNYLGTLQWQQKCSQHPWDPSWNSIWQPKVLWSQVNPETAGALFQMARICLELQYLSYLWSIFQLVKFRWKRICFWWSIVFPLENKRLVAMPAMPISGDWLHQGMKDVHVLCVLVSLGMTPPWKVRVTHLWNSPNVFTKLIMYLRRTLIICHLWRPWWNLEVSDMQGFLELCSHRPKMCRPTWQFAPHAQLPAQMQWVHWWPSHVQGIEKMP